MSCLYGNILGTFHSSPILPVFQFQKFPAKAAKPGQTGLSKAFEFVFKGQHRISTLTRAAGEPALEESERESRSPPPQHSGGGRGESTLPPALEADPQARRPGCRGRASARTHSPRARARPLSAEVERSWSHAPTQTSRYCCSVGGLSLPVTRRTRTACLARLTTGRGGMR